MTEPRGSARHPSRRRLRDLLAVAVAAVAVAIVLGGPGEVQGAAARAALALAAPLPADTDNVVPPAPAAPLSYADSLREPLMVRSVGGILTATLEVDMASLAVPDSAGQKMLDLRAFRLASTTDPAYRGADSLFTPRFPGPTFRVQRGDLVRILLVNKLPELGPQDSNDACEKTPLAPGNIPDVFQSCFHGPNLTNIHYHGMHVTPDSTSTVVGDDVLMAIAPGTQLQYSFRVPQNQSPGTHWYHPHKHGSVALQVTNGMAGAFIVEDSTTGVDSIALQHGMIDHVIAVQQVAENTGMYTGQGLDGSPPLVNGQYQPTVYMAPGEVQRWRIVNENTTKTSKTFDIGFYDYAAKDEPALFDVARDGVQFAPDNYDSRTPDIGLHMAPGQRLDVFVRAPLAAGEHLFQVSHNGGAGRGSRNPSLPNDTDLVNTNASPRADAPPVVVLKVVVDPALRGRNTYLPPTIPPQLPFLSGELGAARDTAVVVFTDSLFRSPTQFYLGSRLNPFQRWNDNTVFVPSNAAGTAMPMVLGETQTWKVVNDSENGINHPFHIHINPFQVNRIVYPLGTNDPFYQTYEQLNAAAARGTPIWLDVLPLPLPRTDTTLVPRDSGKVDTVLTRVEAYAMITQKYDRFEGCKDDQCGLPVGYFVMHCHILGHEERGMMQVLQVVEPGEPVSPPEGHVGPPGHSHGARPTPPPTPAARPAPGTRTPGSGQGRGRTPRGQHQH
ncbi:MAG TPA: multicopper oxidase domain-containing protein [Longimicrobium sp.]|nr:multicopper oxidase domain-containing protein [Longimicrobium sp.]